MSRELTYKKMNDYLEDLVSKNVDLKAFVGSSVNELANKLASNNGVESPFFIFYGYRNRLSGNEQRTHNSKTISFAIAYNGIDANDYVNQKDAIESGELIGLEFLSRIYIDSKSSEIKWLYNNFIKDTVTFEPFEAEEAQGLFGADFSFELKVPEALIVTQAKWTDGANYCNG